MTLYSQYLAEKDGFSVLEDKHGFATYKVFDDVVYIRDIYVTPEMRRTGLAAQMADQICARAKSQGCTSVQGTVDPHLPSATDSIKVLLAYGMKLKSSSPNVIVFEKGI